MDLFKKTKRLCGFYNIRPVRSKGQNFLISERIYNKIITEAELSISEEVLEVGPGLGFMTVKLASKVKRVLAVELDDRLAQILQFELKERGVDNVQILNQNVLDLKLPPNPLSPNYKVVANLPYNITSVFLRKFLSHSGRPDLMVLLLQKEVAERIVAEPPDMSLLALSVQYYTYPKFVKKVPAKSFWPRPKVDSAIIKLKNRNKFLCSPNGEKRLFQLARIGFSSKRKMLKNNLAGGLGISVTQIEKELEHIGFNPRIRAQELSLEDWIKIKNNLKKYERAEQ